MSSHKLCNPIQSQTHLIFRIEIKNIGGGKHQLIFNKLEMTDAGEILCKSGELTSSCKLEVKKGESKPSIKFGDTVDSPANKPIIIDVPYTGLNVPHQFWYQNSDRFWKLGFYLNRYFLSWILVDGTRQTPIEAKLFKDGKALPVKELEVSITEDKVVFTIRKPARGLTGKYQMKLSNGQGEDSKDVFINMQGNMNMLSSSSLMNEPTLIMKRNNSLFLEATITPSHLINNNILSVSICFQTFLNHREK